MNALETYQVRRTAATNQIAMLQDALLALDDEATKAPNDWAIVGTLAEVNSQLEKVLSFLLDEEALSDE